MSAGPNPSSSPSSSAGRPTNPTNPEGTPVFDTDTFEAAIAAGFAQSTKPAPVCEVCGGRPARPGATTCTMCAAAARKVAEAEVLYGGIGAMRTAEARTVSEATPRRAAYPTPPRFPTPGVTYQHAASPKQLKLISDLRAERVVPASWDHCFAAIEDGTITRTQVRALIDGLLKLGKASAAGPAGSGAVDLSGLKQFTSRGLVRVAVPGGDARLKLQVRFAPTGVIYVDDAAEYGERTFYGQQKPGAGYRGKVSAELAAIVADPGAAIIRYSELTGQCGVCGRALEAAESVERGIGPRCWARITA